MAEGGGVLSYAEKQKQDPWNQIQNYLTIRFQRNGCQTYGLNWLVKVIYSDSQVYGTSGVVKLGEVVRVFRILEYSGKFGMPIYFLCALYIHSNNAQYSNNIYSK